LILSFLFSGELISIPKFFESFIYTFYYIFTALHVMQPRYGEEISFCPSVCPSVRHTRGLWQNGRKICPDLYIIRKNIYPSFL